MVARYFGAKVKCCTKVPKIYGKTIISAVMLGFIGISWDVLNILDVPILILALKFDLKIFRNFKIFQKTVTKPLFFGNSV